MEDNIVKKKAIEKKPISKFAKITAAVGITSGLIYGTFLALGSNAYCGKDSGVSCPAPDADGDGYTINGTGLGLDCDDNDWQISPGVWKKVGLNYSVCQTNGTYSANQSTPNGATGSGANYFIDCAAAPGGTGAHNTPWNSVSYVSSLNVGQRPVGWHQVVPGDYTFIGDSCNAELDHDGNALTSKYNFLISGVDGTLANPIKFGTWPGKPRGHITSAVYKSFIAHIETSNYIQMIGLEVSGLGDYGLSIGSGANHSFKNLYIHDVDGDVNNNNTGFAVSAAANNVVLLQSFLLNNYDRQVTAGAATQNMRNAVLFEGTANRIGYSLIAMTNAEVLSTEYGACIGYKHGSTALGVASTFELDHNIIIGCRHAFETGQAGSHVHHNYAEARESFFYLQNVGGPFYPANNLVEYNTFRGPAIAKIESSFSNAPAANNIFKLNVLVSAVGAYHSELATVIDSVYENNTLYDSNVTLAAFDYQQNCYFNTGAALQFNLYNSVGVGNAGRTYTFAEWRVVDNVFPNHKPAWDDDSFNENPTLNTISNATSTNCSNKGYLAGLTGGGSPTPTPAISATPTPAPSVGASVTPLPSATGNVGDFNKRPDSSIWDL